MSKLATYDVYSIKNLSTRSKVYKVGVFQNGRLIAELPETYKTRAAALTALAKLRETKSLETKEVT